MPQEGQECSRRLPVPASSRIPVIPGAGPVAAIVSSRRLTTVLSAIDRATTPVLLAPSMNDVMWGQPSTKRNAQTLRDDGYRFVGPEEGWMACRSVGPGRMAEPDQLLQAIAAALPRR